MTSSYETQFGAICIGMFYAGRPDLYRKGYRYEMPDTIPEKIEMMSIPKDTPFLKSLEEVLEEKKEEVTLVEGGRVAQFGNELSDCQMVEFLNQRGVKVRVASCRFREDEWDCWLIDEKTGMGWRL